MSKNKTLSIIQFVIEPGSEGHLTTPLTDTQVKQVQQWLDEDWESNDIDRDVVALIQRLVNTCDLLRGQYLQALAGPTGQVK